MWMSILMKVPDMLQIYNLASFFVLAFNMNDSTRKLFGNKMRFSVQFSCQLNPPAPRTDFRQREELIQLNGREGKSKWEINLRGEEGSIVVTR